VNRKTLQTLLPFALAVLFVATGAQAQLLGTHVELFKSIEELAPDAAFQDMNSLPTGVAETPEGAPSHGEVLGPTFSGTGRLSPDIDGKALVVLDGKPYVQEAGGPMDGFYAGSGYRASFVLPVSQIQFQVVGQDELEIEVEAFFQFRSLAPPQRFRVTRDNDTFTFGTDGIFWDAIEIRSVNDSPGWGLDNLGIGGKMAARSVVCQDTAKLSTLRF
jgi:hypothetical protein